MDREVPGTHAAERSNAEFSFVELQRRLAELPDGPSGILDTPPPYRVLTFIGWAGVALALLPAALIRIMTPAMWMVTMAQIGLAVVAVAWLPMLVRSYGVLGWTLWRWKEDQVAQLDHDHPHFQAILTWMSGFPTDTLTEYHRTAQLAHKQLAAKLGLLAGGVDRLGMLPVFVSVYLFLRNWADLPSMPLWQLGLGVFLVLLYLITTAASLKRIRMQLYESLLSDALERKRNMANVAANL